MAKPLITKTFKGISYSAFRDSPNIYVVKIGSQKKPITTFYITGDDKIDKIARNVINQVRKYGNDGLISSAESVKLDRYISDLLKKENVNVKTLTPITKSSDIIPGCVIIPRNVDIVATEDILIIKSIVNKNIVNNKNKVKKVLLFSFFISFPPFYNLIL